MTGAGADHAERMRGALTGALIGSGAGIGWGLWGASGLSGASAALAGGCAVLAGVLLIVANRLVDRDLAATTGGGQAPPTRFSRGYWLVVAAEAVAIAAGVAVISSTGHEAARAPWVCLIVGLHFVVLGRMWHAPPLLGLAAALSLVGIIMLIAAFAGGSVTAVTAVTGLVAAGVFFISAAFAVGSAIALTRTPHQTPP